MGTLIFECFSKSGSRKYQFKEHIKSVGMTERLPPRIVPTRWVSSFTVVKYHAEYLHAERNFLVAELKNHEGGMLLNLRRKLIDNHDNLHAQFLFISIRAKPFITILEVLESDLALGTLLYGYFEDVIFEFSTQKLLTSESIEEIFCNVELNKELQQSISMNIKRAVTFAETKVLRYFDEKDGIHPSNRFLHDLQFLNPKKA